MTRRRSRPRRGIQVQHTLLAHRQLQGVGEHFLPQPQPPAFGDDGQASGVGQGTFQQARNTQAVAGKKMAARLVRAGIEHGCLYHQRGLGSPAGRSQRQQTAAQRGAGGGGQPWLRPQVRQQPSKQ